MIETYFISDTHFGHKGIIEFDSTKPFRNFSCIEEHDEELIKRWNSVVRKNDNVWHLGDFCFGRCNIKIADRLNGNKKLVMGNHDQYGAAEYISYFKKIYGVAVYKDMILSHVPLHISQLQRWSINIHGHLHTNKIDDARFINVSCEQINLTPVPLSYIYNLVKIK